MSINNLKINLPDDTNLLNLSLDSSLGEREPKLNLYLKDKQKNILEVGILSSENSNGELVKGYIQSNKFKLDDALIGLICRSCNFNAELQTLNEFYFLSTESFKFSRKYQFNNK